MDRRSDANTGPVAPSCGHESICLSWCFFGGLSFPSLSLLRWSHRFQRVLQQCPGLLAHDLLHCRGHLEGWRPDETSRCPLVRESGSVFPFLDVVAQVVAWGFFWDKNSYLRDVGTLAQRGVVLAFKPKTGHFNPLECQTLLHNHQSPNLSCKRK